MAEAIEYTCKFCTAGTAFKNKAESCTACVGGQYQESNTLATAVCKTCSAGLYSTGATAVCKNCEDGKFQELAEAIEYTCKFCAAGTAFDTTGSSCTSCSSGKFQEQDSAASVTCKQCAAGTEWKTTSDVCDTCADGKYQEQNTADSVSCKFCAAGTAFKNKVESCTACVVGQYQEQNDANSVVCKFCVAGTEFTDEATTCDNCVSGKYQEQNSVASVKCKYCEEGKFQPEVGKPSCDNCAVGLYSSNIGSASNITCKACITGTFSSLSGSTECNFCQTGKYANEKATIVCKDCPVHTSLFDGFGNEYGSNTLDHDNENDCKSCPGEATAPIGSSLCTCQYRDGKTRNNFQCICQDDDSTTTCINNRYCYIGTPAADWNQSTRCGASGGEIIIGGVFLQTCPDTTGIEQIFSDKCVCGTGTTVCNRYQYCNDISTGTNPPDYQCQDMTDCRKNGGLFENTGDCVCRSRDTSTYITCNSTTGRVCNSQFDAPTCMMAMCVNNVASIINTIECRCMRTRESTLRQEMCKTGEYCFDPVSVACSTSVYDPSPFPDCGCTEKKIESCMSEQGQIDGTTPNLLSEYCSCTSIIYGDNSLCLKGEYCNREFGVCAGEPAPSCRHKDGKTVNLEPCLCGTEQCGVGGYMCSPTALIKCHKQLCSDYEDLNPNWCNVDAGGKGNGVIPGNSCRDYTCSDDDIHTCCAGCTGASIWGGVCRKKCPDAEDTSLGDGAGASFCFDEWVDPPTYNEYMKSNDYQNSPSISYAWFKQNNNPFYAGHCLGAVCDSVITNISNSTTDSKYCCLPSKNCKDDASGLLCQGSEYTKEIKDKRCSNFFCTPAECCVPTQCECSNGEGTTGRDCPIVEYNCASCYNGYWLSGSECIAVSPCDSDSLQYEFRPPSGFSDRICYRTSVCNDAQYELTPPTSTSDRGCSTLTICASNEYIEKTSNISTGFKISDIECAAFPTCTDVQYMVKTVNTADGVSVTNYSCDTVTVCGPLEFETEIPTSDTDRVCNTTTLCQDNQYERTRPSLTTDRICVAPTVCNTTNEYETLGPTNITNRICNTIKKCDSTEFETIGPTNITDRVCNSSTTCQSNEYETSPLTNYTDRTCQVAKRCDVDILEYESIPMTTTSDRSCKQCSPTDDDCVGCMTKTDCEFNTKSNIHNQSKCSSLTCTRFIIPDGTFSGILHYGEWFRFESNSTTPFVISAPNIIQKVNYSYFYIETDFNGTITFQGVALRIQQDCTFEEYTWGACSNMCGAGHELGIRGPKIKNASHGGKICSETPKITYRDCNGTFCPIDCNITWDDSYLPCNAACGVQGIQYKNYTIHNPAKYGGVECPALKRRGCVGLNKPPYCDCLKRKMDACGICGGDSSTCTGCDGVVDRNEETRKVYNECGICARKGTPCALKRSQTQKDRKKFRSNLLKILLPVGTAVLLFAASFGVVFFLTRPKTQLRKKREIYLS